MMRYNRTSRRRSFDWGYLLIGTVIAAFGLVVVGFTLAFFSSGETVTCKVENKDRASTVDGASDMRLYTEDCDVLSVSDVPFVQWDSASVYNDIDPGKTYEFKTLGWRIPILSTFPVVIESTEVS